MEVTFTCLISRKTNMQFGLWVPWQVIIYLEDTHLELHQENQSTYDLWYVKIVLILGLKISLENFEKSFAQKNQKRQILRYDFVSKLPSWYLVVQSEQWKQ